MAKLYLYPKDPSVLKIVRRANSLWREEKRYGNSKTLRIVLRSACFSRRKRGRKTVRIAKRTMAVAKYYGFGRRTIFSTEGSFGYG